MLPYPMKIVDVLWFQGSTHFAQILISPEKDSKLCEMAQFDESLMTQILLAFLVFQIFMVCQNCFCIELWRLNND